MSENPPLICFEILIVLGRAASHIESIGNQLTELARSKGQSAGPGGRIPRIYLGLVEQDHVQQGIMDFQLSVVLDKA
jgi:hypothetical protein